MPRRQMQTLARALAGLDGDTVLESQHGKRKAAKNFRRTAKNHPLGDLQQWRLQEMTTGDLAGRCVVAFCTSGNVMTVPFAFVEVI